ncbi:MAG: hypothetical protein USCAAHI_02356 [Beijerinckiaceae bacterium]|nr:MAG: hypothetical protein USCAAHI_02356 [Beijerinckiaceae bacterium]
MRVGRIGADDHHHVGLLDRIEILSSGRRAESGPEAIAGRRMADPRAGIDIVVAEAGANEFLDEIGLFVGAARRGDAADRIAAIFGLDALEFGSRVVEGLVPRHFAPGVADLLADHRIEDALLVGSVTPGEAALDAGMAVVRLAVLVGHHADEFLAPHFRLEAAADAAIGAGRYRRMFRLADVDHRLLDERRGRAGLDAGAAGNAFRLEEGLHLARRNAAPKAAPVDGEREGPLHFLAGANAAVANDAFRRIIGEIGVGFVLFVGEMIGAVIAVAHIAQPDVARLRLQFAIAVGGAGEAIERMIRDIPSRLCAGLSAPRSGS